MLEERGKILLLGDSITQLSFSAALSGWGAHVADTYQRRADVYNRGFSGYNTDWFVKYLETETGERDLFLNSDSQNGSTSSSSSSNVKFITIFFGANDASDEKLNPRHHVPIPRFQSNLRKIVKFCREHHGQSVRILLITPPPVHHDSRLLYQVEKYGKEGATGLLERTLQLSEKYADAVEGVAAELDVSCLNLWKEMQNNWKEVDVGDNGKSETSEKSNDLDKTNVEEETEGWKIFLSDGLHLSREGNMYVGRRVVEMISKSYPDIAVSVCPKSGLTGHSGSKGGMALGSSAGIGPWHDQINYKDADAVFERSSKKRKL